jgi:hypothetical protein
MAFTFNDSFIYCNFIVENYKVIIIYAYAIYASASSIFRPIFIACLYAKIELVR